MRLFNINLLVIAASQASAIVALPGGSTIEQSLEHRAVDPAAGVPKVPTSKVEGDPTHQEVGNLPEGGVTAPGAAPGGEGVKAPTDAKPNTPQAKLDAARAKLKQQQEQEAQSKQDLAKFEAEQEKKNQEILAKVATMKFDINAGGSLKKLPTKNPYEDDEGPKIEINKEGKACKVARKVKRNLGIVSFLQSRSPTDFARDKTIWKQFLKDWSATVNADQRITRPLTGAVFGGVSVALAGGRMAENGQRVARRTGDADFVFLGDVTPLEKEYIVNAFVTVQRAYAAAGSPNLYLDFSFQDSYHPLTLENIRLRAVTKNGISRQGGANGLKIVHQNWHMQFVNKLGKLEKYQRQDGHVLQRDLDDLVSIINEATEASGKITLDQLRSYARELAIPEADVERQIANHGKLIDTYYKNINPDGEVFARDVRKTFEAGSPMSINTESPDGKVSPMQVDGSPSPMRKPGQQTEYFPLC